MTKILSTGIPQRIVRDDQAFQLVALIEGAAANTQFISNLQVIGQQRRLLADARQQLEALPKSAVEAERTALQNQISQLDARLTLNMQFMTKTYGYSVEHNYLLVPVNAALLEKGVDAEGKPSEDEAKATLVAEFLTSESYDELQALRDRVGRLAADPAKADDLAAARALLKDKFGFDTAKHYILQVRKGALYASLPA